ncbi:MAG: hypothetical protein KDD99_13365 [Bacteroidetes bacterium]|nr:hypothetical protein [Bacteroidota bacterium]
MRVQNFLIISAAIYIPLGLIMVFFPKFLYGLYGFDLGPAGKILGRVVGSAIIGLGFINLISSTDKKETIAMGAILFGNLIYHFIDLFLVTPPTIRGEVNQLTWMFVAIHLILTIGFGHFLLRH